MALVRSPGRYNSLKGAGMAAAQLGNGQVAREYYTELMRNIGDNTSERNSLNQLRLIMARL